MNKKLLSCMYMALGLIFIFNPITVNAKSNNDIRETYNSKSSGITCNNADFEYNVFKDLPPVIGIGWSIGTIMDIYEEDKFTFIRIEEENGESKLFYASDNIKDKIDNLKENSKLTLKYTLGTPKKSKGKMAMPLTQVLIPLDKSEFKEENWQNLNSYEDVPLNKPWTIHFNKELCKENITYSNICLVDSTGVKIPINISISENKKDISIFPQREYKANGGYYIFIENTIDPKIKNSRKGFKMEFHTSN